MADMYTIHIIRKNGKTFTTISTAPVKEVYAMLYGAIELVAQNTNQSFERTMETLLEIHDFAKRDGQR